MEEAGSSSSPRPESPSALTPETEGDMESGLLDVDLDGYQTTLEEVLTWLLSAEDTLQVQDEVSDDVEEVKEQFHTHEVFFLPFVFLRQMKLLVFRPNSYSYTHCRSWPCAATHTRCMLGMLRILLRRVLQSPP